MDDISGFERCLIGSCECPSPPQVKVLEAQLSDFDHPAVSVDCNFQSSAVRNDRFLHKGLAIDLG